MTNASTIGREPFVVVEIDQDECQLEYGVAPCVAAVGVTGDRKCFKTRATCQDPDNYDLGAKTLRFCVAVENSPRTSVLIPIVVGVSTVPGELNVGGGDSSSSPLGTRASVTITFTDMPHHDRGVDPYWRERDYDPLAAGTFWSKWLARNPYYQSRPIRVLFGYVGDALEDMKVRHYVIDKIDGPTGGRVQITAKDPIKLLDFVRAQAPFPSDCVLLSVLEETDVVMTADASGTGDQTVPLSGIGTLNGEVIRYSRVGNTFTLHERGMHKTDISSAKIGDSFQPALVYDRVRVDIVIRELLETYTDFPPAFIDAVAWASECELWSASLTVSTIITEPTGVSKLIAELIQQTLCYIWWDEIAQELRLKALRARLPQVDDVPPALDSDSHFVAGKTSIEDRPEDRITQVWIYYDKIDPTAGDDEKNYASLRIQADNDAESANEYNEQRIKTIFARWLGNGSDAIAFVLAIRILQRYRDTPKVFNFSLDAKDGEHRVGDFLRWSHKDFVDFTGQPKEITVQVTSLEEVEPGHRNELSSRVAPGFMTNGGFIVADGTVDYGAATTEQKFMGAWIAPDTGVFANGDPAYRMI